MRDIQVEEQVPITNSILKTRYDILSKVHNVTCQNLKDENESIKKLLLEYIPESSYYKKVVE